MPKTSSQCLTCLLDDDGMKDRELVARASVDETDNVKILSLLHKQGHKREGGIQDSSVNSCKKNNPKPFEFPLSRRMFAIPFDLVMGRKRYVHETMTAILNCPKCEKKYP